jgi:HEAT repeat protein
MMMRILLSVALTAGFGASAQAQLPPVTPAPPVAPAPPAPAAPSAPRAHVAMPDLHLELSDLSSVDLRWHQPFQQSGVGVGIGLGKGPQPRDLDNQYDQARNLIEQNQYERAIVSFERVISGHGSQAAGAMYWKAYSLARVARRPEALTTLDELIKQFPKSPWIKDAQALQLELRQASGQSVNADAQGDDELKLLALRGLMQSDPESALPVIEKMLNGPSSVRVKDRALFVVSQSRSTRGRTLIVGVAKGNSNPDLQLRAIRYIGQMGGPEASQTLDEVYRGTSDERVKREIIRALGNANARERLLALARSETTPELRGDAVRALGNMSATTELDQLYRSESSAEVKQRILQGLQNGNAADKLAALARSETDPQLRLSVIRYLGNMRGSATTETLTSLYASEQSEDVKKAIIQALSNGDRAAALVALARSEKNQTLKAEIVRRLGNTRDPVARQYLLELLNQ